MKLQAPVLLAVAVPIWVAPSNTLMVAFAAALPVNVSVLSLVMPSPATPLSFEIFVMVGAPGALGWVGGVLGAFLSCNTAPFFILTLLMKIDLALPSSGPELG